MDALVLAEFVLRDIRQQKADMTQRLADGAVETIQDYRFIVGQIRGLTQCEDVIRAAMKGVEIEDG